VLEGDGDDERVDEGGDPACWLELVCERCGRVVEPPGPHRCPAGGTDPPDGFPRAAGDP
jgi:hypothetical protein